MRILITGAEGQDGLILSNIHRKYGDMVVGTIRPEKKNYEKNEINYYSLDLSKPKECEEFLSFVKPDLIYHLATVHGSATDMDLLIKKKNKELKDIQVNATTNLVSYLKENQKTKLLVALSSKMYSTNGEIKKINEDTPIEPENEYGKAKYRALAIIKKEREVRGIRASGLILFNHTSPLSKKEFLFPKIAKSLKSKTIEEVVSELKFPEACIDISDAYEICDGISRIGLSNFSEEFVLGSGKLVQIKKVITSLSSENQNESVERNDSQCQEGLVSDPEKMMKLFNWRAKKEAAELLKEMVSSCDLPMK